MVQKIIGLGVPDKGNGDPLRTAFSKVNENFTELYNSVSAVVVTGATAPTSPGVGDLWWDTESGRMYVYYGTSWVDASPVDGAGISSTNQLVNGAHTVSLSSAGLTAFPAISNESLFIQASELGSANASIGISAKDSVIVTANILSTAKQWTFGTDGSLTMPGDLHGAEVFLSGEQPEPIVIGHTLNITPAANASDKKFGFRIDQSDGVYLNSYLDMPTAENNKHVSISFALTDAIGPDSIGYIWNQGTDTNVTNLNNAFNIFANNTNIKLTTQGSDNNQSTWTFGTDGSLTLPLGSTLGETPAATTVTIYGAGASAFNQTYTRTYGDLTYPDQYLGSNNCRIFRDSGTANKWRIREVSTDYYESDDLVTWTDFIGGADPAPTGIVSLKTADITVGTNTWAFGADGALTFPDGTTTSGKGITLPVNQSLTVTVSHDEPPPGHTNTFKINPESIKLPTGNGTIFSGTETAANAWHLDSANKTLFFPNAGDGVFPQIKYSTTGNDGMQLLTAAKPIKITVESNTHWTFGTDGALTVPSVLWNYTPTTFTSIPTTYGTAQLTFTVLPDNTFTNMSVAVGGGGYGADNQQLTVPGTTFPGGASPANDIVFNVTTFPVPDFPSEITTASIVTYVSGNPPQRYDNIESSGSVGIGANNSHWTFGTNGALTLPDASVIASYKPVTVIAATTTAQTITDNASAAFIQFVDTVDTASAYSTGTFTAPYTGYYQINMSVYFSTTVSLTSTSFLLIDTNLDFTKQVRIIDGNWTGSYLHYSTVISATAGDAIRVAFRQVSGGDIDVSSGSRLTIHRVSIS